MITIFASTSSRSPIIFNPEYQEGLQRVAYCINTRYNWHAVGTEYTIVPDNEQKVYVPYKEHAYGYLINPFSSKVLVLDVDVPKIETFGFILRFLFYHSNVECIDIVTSSRNIDGTPKGHHIYAGLSTFCNLMPIYKANIRGTCSGFNTMIEKQGQIIIRYSPKYLYNTPDQFTFPTCMGGYKRIGESKWEKFTQEQLTVPLTTVDVQSYAKTERRSTLKLRG